MQDCKTDDYCQQHIDAVKDVLHQILAEDTPASAGWRGIGFLLSMILVFTRSTSVRFL